MAHAPRHGYPVIFPWPGCLGPDCSSAHEVSLPEALVLTSPNSHPVASLRERDKTPTIYLSWSKANPRPGLQMTRWNMHHSGNVPYSGIPSNARQHFYTSMLSEIICGRQKWTSSLSPPWHILHPVIPVPSYAFVKRCYQDQCIPQRSAALWTAALLMSSSNTKKYYLLLLIWAIFWKCGKKNPEHFFF